VRGDGLGWKSNKQERRLTDETRLPFLPLKNLGAEVGQTGGNKDNSQGQEAGHTEHRHEGRVPEGDGHFPEEVGLPLGCPRPLPDKAEGKPEADDVENGGEDGHELQAVVKVYPKEGEPSREGILDGPHNGGHQISQQGEQA